MIKWLIMIILFFLCILIGYYFSQRYVNRLKFFKSLILLCQNLDIEINYSRERLKKLINNYDEKTKKNLLGIDQEFLKYLDNPKELKKEELFKNAGILKKEEQDLIFLFFKNLGRSDVENQTKELKNFIAKFEEIKIKAENENKKYGSLSLKLGLIIGLFILVILI
ncbi:MAG: stage III sporulation protein AB [Clostridia bacterium]|nr:stage III sporulation protein AB [Clostridia bacterium]